MRAPRIEVAGPEFCSSSNLTNSRTGRAWGRFYSHHPLYYGPLEHWTKP